MGPATRTGGARTRGSRQQNSRRRRRSSRPQAAAAELAPAGGGARTCCHGSCSRTAPSSACVVQSGGAALVYAVEDTDDLFAMPIGEDSCTGEPAVAWARCDVKAPCVVPARRRKAPAPREARYLLVSGGWLLWSTERSWPTARPSSPSSGPTSVRRGGRR